MEPHPDPERAPRRVSFPRSTWAVIAVLAAIPMLSLLLQLVVVEDQRRTIRDQRELTDRLLGQAAEARDEAQPLLRAAPGLVSELKKALPAAKATGRRVDNLTKAATPLARELRSSGAAGSLSDLGDLVAELQRTDLTATLRSARQVSGELLAQNRLQRLLVRSVGVLGEVRERNLIPKAANAAQLAPEIVTLLRASLRAQRQTLELNRQTLEVARDTNAHAASLDRKLGGEAPPATGRR